jgi:sortase (surface protein transpeptidase)
LRWWMLPTALLLAGIVTIAWGLHGGGRALPEPHPSAAALRAAVTPPTVAAPLSTTRSLPVSLQIPAIGVSLPLGALGENADGTVQVPSTSQQAGWFDLGPTPGQIGSAVILGHVDSYQGPGVFFNLRTLAEGDQIDVALADGITDVFTVVAVNSYTKTQFPAQQVYGSYGISALQLVTCGGVFDHQTGSYLSNVVVYSALTAVTPAPLVATTTTTSPG